MSKNATEHGRHVRKVQEDTNRYAQELLAENEALRILTTSLRDDNQHLRASVAGLVRALHGLLSRTAIPPLIE